MNDVDVVINVLDVINVMDAIDVIDVIEKTLQTHLLIYHPLRVKCLQYDNVTSNIQ